jgi:hypothetical protein
MERLKLAVHDPSVRRGYRGRAARVMTDLEDVCRQTWPSRNIARDVHRDGCSMPSPRMHLWRRETAAIYKRPLPCRSFPLLLQQLHAQVATALNRPYVTVLVRNHLG